MEREEEDPLSDCEDSLPDDSDSARKLLANKHKVFTSAYKTEIAEQLELVLEEERNLRQLVEEIKEHERSEIAWNPLVVVQRDWMTMEAIQRRVRRKLAIREPQIAASKNARVVVRDWPWTAEEDRQREEEEEEEEEEKEAESGTDSSTSAEDSLLSVDECDDHQIMSWQPHKYTTVSRTRGCDCTTCTYDSLVI